MLRLNRLVMAGRQHFIPELLSTPLSLRPAGEDPQSITICSNRRTHQHTLPAEHTQSQISAINEPTPTHQRYGVKPEAEQCSNKQIFIFLLTVTSEDPPTTLMLAKGTGGRSVWLHPRSVLHRRWLQVTSPALVSWIYIGGRRHSSHLSVSGFVCNAGFSTSIKDLIPPSYSFIHIQTAGFILLMLGARVYCPWVGVCRGH